LFREEIGRAALGCEEIASCGIRVEGLTAIATNCPLSPSSPSVCQRCAGVESDWYDDLDAAEF
jgi:hypothetical protein